MLTNLPVQFTSFIGRQQELNNLRRILAGSRLLTLTGPGGSGKTRLAIELARTQDAEFADGVAWVDLVSLADETLVAETVAAALNAPEIPGLAVEESLVDFLVEKKFLLLLDNCEHLIHASAEFVELVLRSCPGAKVIATSLEALQIPGENAWPVPPLSFPGKEQLSPDDVSQYEAVKLFIDRVRNQVPGFDLTNNNSAAIGRICRRLDGLPLAVELAASRANVLTPQQIADRLDDRFALLTSKARTTSDPRHRTLQATIDWSYQLLSSAEQRLFRRLAIFEGPFSLSGAEAIGSDERITPDRILDLLTALVTQSLLMADTASSPEARYRLLETIKAYAWQQLQAAGEKEEMRRRHLDYTLAAVEEGTPYLVGSYQKSWFSWLRGQQDDIRAALRYSLASGRITAGLQLLEILGRSQYWAEQRYVQEWQSWLAQLIEHYPAKAPAELLLTSLTNATSFCGLLGNSMRALDYGKRALTLAQDIGDENLLARTLNSLARAYAAGGDFQRSYELNKQAVQIHRRQGSLMDVGYVNLNVVLDAVSLGWFEEAEQQLTESLAISRQANQPLLEAHSYNVLGELEFCREAFEEAYHAYETSLPILQRANAERDVAALLLRLGFTHLQLNDLDGADGRFQDYRELQRNSGTEQGLSEYLTGYGALACKVGQPELAGQLLASAVLQTGAAAMAFYPTGRYMVELYLAQVRQEIGEQRFNVNQAKGRRLALEQALAIVDDHIRPLLAAVEPGSQRAGPLTERQQEVAILVAQGKSNGQIAEALFLSKRTVEKHVANILAALELENRAQIIRWVIESRGA